MLFVAKTGIFRIQQDLSRSESNPVLLKRYSSNKSKLLFTRVVEVVVNYPRSLYKQTNKQTKKSPHLPMSILSGYFYISLENNDYTVS